MLKMKRSQFAVWNFIDAAAYVLAAGELDWGSLGALVAGLAVAAGCAVLAARYYRRRHARRPAGFTPRE
jgi:O-antigen/teichoic acid export membrane protein